MARIDNCAERCANILHLAKMGEERIIDKYRGSDFFVSIGVIGRFYLTFGFDVRRCKELLQF